MREQKFRAWNEERGEMIYFGLFDTDCGYHIQAECSLDEFPTMQYIGLKDKNKKEIYDGDIIEFDKFEWYKSPLLSRADIEKKPPFLEEVKWDFSLLDMRQNDYPAYCKIIGNIYKNPELLEDK